MFNQEHQMHLATYCNNRSTASCVAKMMSCQFWVGQWLIQAPMLCLAHNHTMPLISLSILGILSDLDNPASQFFTPKATTHSALLSDHAFLSHFNSLFPLTHGISWHLAILHQQLTMKVFSELCQQLLPLALWWQLCTTGHTIEMPSVSTASWLQWIQCSTYCQWPPPPVTYKLLWNGYKQGEQDEFGKLVIKWFWLRFVPLAQSLNWLDTPTHATKQSY